MHTDQSQSSISRPSASAIRQVDLMPAWNGLGARARDAYRRALDVDDADYEHTKAVVAETALPSTPFWSEVPKWAK